MQDPKSVTQATQPTMPAAPAGGGTRASRLRWLVVLVLGCFAIYMVPKIIRATGEAVGDQAAKVIDGAGKSVSAAANGVLDRLAKFVTPEVKNFWETRVLESQKQTRLNIASWRGTIAQRKTKTSWPFAVAEVEVKRPAEVQLYVPLTRGRWDFEVKGKTLYVYAPAIEAGKAAVDNAHTERHILQSCWRISESAMLEEAEHELDESADKLAAAQAARIIDHAREGVADFVMQWVVKRYYPDGGGVKVEVLFPGDLQWDERTQASKAGR